MILSIFIIVLIEKCIVPLFFHSDSLFTLRHDGKDSQVAL